MNYYIVTGSSRGIGEALIKVLLEEECTVIGVSRGGNSKLCDGDYNGEYIDFVWDLADINKIDELLYLIFEKIDIKDAKKLALVNNAALLNPVKPIHECKSLEIQDHMNVNLLAPMILCSGLIKYAAHLQIEKTIFNISSGAAHNPYYGWSAYCTSKAGINMLTRTIAEEQYNAINPVKLVSFAPGVVETKMQEEIRNSNERDFILKDKFVKLKENGQLLAPEDVAKVIARNIFNDNISQGAIIDVREMNMET
jgi:benzil reductase ((S)-benzoin forming)